MILLDSMGHLSSTESAQALHEFAQSIGLRREWYQMPGYGDHHGHYDVMGRMGERSFEAGAHRVSPEELIKTSWWYHQPFRALSLKPPWTELVVNGIKPVENRKWATKYRGALLIHASKTWDTEGALWILRNTDAEIGARDDYIYGAIIGQVDLVDCVTWSSTGHAGPYGNMLNNSTWFFGPIGWVLGKAKAYKRPVYWRGELGVFEVPHDFMRGGEV